MAVEHPQTEMVAPGIYEVRFPKTGVTVTASRIKEKNDDTHAELTIVHDFEGHLKRLKLNLTSEQSHKSLAKTLKERSPEPDWFGIVENTCLALLEVVRQGEPVINLATHTDTAFLKWRLWPFIIEGEANVIYGPGDTGKSMTATLAAIMITNGIERYGMSVEQGNVLYLDWETNPAEVGTRAKGLCAGLGIEMPPINYRYMTQTLAHDAEALMAIVHDMSINVLIVDSMGPAINGDDNKSGPINELFNVLRSLKVTTLIIDHENKDGGQYGSIYKYNRARNIWKARPSESARVDGIAKIAMYHEKINNGRRMTTPLGLSFSFEEEGRIYFHRVDVVDDPEFASRIATRVRAREYIKRDGPANPETITSALNEGVEARNYVKADSVRKAMDRSEEFIRLPTGEYALRALGEANAVVEEFINKTKVDSDPLF